MRGRRIPAGWRGRKGEFTGTKSLWFYGLQSASYCPHDALLNKPAVAATTPHEVKRRRPDSNRGWRICNPLPYHLAKGPGKR